MWRKIFQKYTKSFGGKIWANLHSVSPYNIFVTKIDRVFLAKISAIKLLYSISRKIFLHKFKYQVFSKKKYYKQCFPTTTRAQGYVARQDTVYCAYYLLPAQEIFMLQGVEVSSTSYNTKIYWTGRW